jgi:hypothetical protein
VTEHSFDALTRSLGRRRAVQALTAAAATTLSGVAVVGAKSNNGKKQKKKKKSKQQEKKIQTKALALCATQVSQCVALTGDNGVGAVCCLELADCDLSALFTCLSGI